MRRDWENWVFAAKLSLFCSVSFVGENEYLPPQRPGQRGWWWCRLRPDKLWGDSTVLRDLRAVAESHFCYVVPHWTFVGKKMLEYSDQILCSCNILTVFYGHLRLVEYSSLRLWFNKFGNKLSPHFLLSFLSLSGCLGIGCRGGYLARIVLVADLAFVSCNVKCVNFEAFGKNREPWGQMSRNWENFSVAKFSLNITMEVYASTIN